MIIGENFLQDLGNRGYIVWQVIGTKLRVGSTPSIVTCRIIATDICPEAHSTEFVSDIDFPTFERLMIPMNTAWSFPPKYQRT